MRASLSSIASIRSSARDGPSCTALATVSSLRPPRPALSRAEASAAPFFVSSSSTRLSQCIFAGSAVTTFFFRRVDDMAAAREASATAALPANLWLPFQETARIPIRNGREIEGGR